MSTHRRSWIEARDFLSSADNVVEGHSPEKEGPKDPPGPLSRLITLRNRNALKSDRPCVARSKVDLSLNCSMLYFIGREGFADLACRTIADWHCAADSIQVSVTIQVFEAYLTGTAAVASALTVTVVRSTVLSINPLIPYRRWYLFFASGVDASATVSVIGSTLSVPLLVD